MLLSGCRGVLPAALPSVAELQQYLTEAYAAGYDREGARTLNNGQVEGTRVWIGAVEVATVLYHHYNLSAYVVDFPHRPDEDISARVMKYVRGYYASTDTLVFNRAQHYDQQFNNYNLQTNKPPLYM